VYGIEKDITWAMLTDVPETVFSGQTGMQTLKSVSPGSFIVRMPGYQAFTDSAREVLSRKARFIEIAGNRQIMVTAVVPSEWNYKLSQGELLFASPILTDAGYKRVAIRSPVSELQALNDEMPIKHIYDY
jgi:hypothetical protein